MIDYEVRIEYCGRTATVRSLEGEDCTLSDALIAALEMLTDSLDTKKVASDLVVGLLEYAAHSAYPADDLGEAEESLYLAAVAFNKAYADWFYGVKKRAAKLGEARGDPA